MPEVSDWYKGMLDQFMSFQSMADSHWERGKPLSGIEFIHTRDNSANGTFSPNPEKAKAALDKLWISFNTKPHLDQSSPYIKSEMYHLLGLWLCSFFLGIAQPDCWERVVALANRLGTYPGGAFYSKLSGDIYRYERRRKEKARSIDSADDNPLLVMAFDPIVLIPLREDREAFLEDASGLDDVEINFRRRVGQLAFRYLRLEAWRYWSDPENPIIYMVSQELASKALKKIEPPPNKTLTSLSLEHLLKLLDVKGSTDQRRKQEILIVNPESARLKGLSSCYLGSSDGVLAVRPNHPDRASAYCSWIKGEVLTLERKKLTALKEEVISQNTCTQFDAANTAAFNWYDPSDWVVVKKET